MKRRPSNPLLAWNSLALRWMEMMTASGQVIAHRTSRNNTPAQMFTMGSEKAVAALQSSHAMTRQLMARPPTSAAATWDAWARLLSSGIAPYRARARRNARSISRR